MSRIPATEEALMDIKVGRYSNPEELGYQRLN
jgi:hypothetical protein